VPTRPLIALGLAAVTAAMAVAGRVLTSAGGQVPRAPSHVAPGVQTEAADASGELTDRSDAAVDRHADSPATEQADAARHDLARLRRQGAQAVDRNLDVARSEQVGHAAQDADRMRGRQPGAGNTAASPPVARHPAAAGNLSAGFRSQPDLDADEEE
jgi:hypothetical protein